jgi:hypothetical protein
VLGTVVLVVEVVVVVVDVVLVRVVAGSDPPDEPPPPQAIKIWVAATVAISRSLNDTGIPLRLEK